MMGPIFGAPLRGRFTHTHQSGHPSGLDFPASQLGDQPPSTGSLELTVATHVGAAQVIGGCAVRRLVPGPAPGTPGPVQIQMAGQFYRNQYNQNSGSSPVAGG